MCSNITPLFHSFEFASFNAFIMQSQIFLYLFFMYLYSVEYLHVLQDTKCYFIDPTVQVQPDSQVTDIPLTERQRIMDDHLFNVEVR